ncbi:endonuclease domain-containing protein [Streptomyces sp. NPDC050848]|uniref:endonuclease domain-containing protein n=1 Tax=Streptomyces sp. NPDC050848 TaxID=3155791 RepID=UPI0033C3662D
MTSTCGRPTTKGTPCKLPPATWWWIRHDAHGLLPRSCAAHLQGKERELYRSTKAAHEERRRIAEAHFAASEPACWSWPVPDDLSSWEPPVEYSVGPVEHQLPQDVVAQLVAFDRTPDGRAWSMLSWWQAGRCALCGVATPDLAEDHDHVSGLVRGYLCRSCNTREGLNGAPDTPFGRYRAKHPTAILGLELRYWDPFTKDYAPDLRGEPQHDPWSPEGNALIGIGL